jgi:predicted nucleotidyltransferase
MRLSAPASTAIRETVRSVLGPSATVRLFGSRADDSARGGDIDLLVETDKVVEQPTLVAARIGALLQMALGDQRIDVLISAPNVQDQAIHRVARSSGITL